MHCRFPVVFGHQQEDQIAQCVSTQSFLYLNHCF